MEKKLLSLILVVTIFCSFTACSTLHPVTKVESLPAEVLSLPQHLKLSLQRAPENDATISFTSEELGNNFKNGLSYHHVQDVTIEVTGVSMPLEEALKTGAITEEEIFCSARMDARDGLCRETTASRLGVSGYTYHYPDYSLSLTHDVYELPDGTQYPVSCCDIFLPNANGTEYHYGPYTGFLDGETGLYIDREDWGLDFEASSTAPYELTLACNQSGGQQIGALKVVNFSLSSENGLLVPLENDNVLSTYTFDIPANQSSSFTISWQDHYEPLPSGAYTLSLYVQDVFTPEQVHPLMKDYYQMQIYDVPFTIK